MRAEVLVARLRALAPMNSKNSMISTALWVVCAWTGIACSKPPLREWRPSDHQSVQSQTAQSDQAGQTGQTGQASPPEQPKPPTERAAAALWAMSCAPCHGEEGRGDGEQRPPGAHMADFTLPTWQASMTDAQIASVLTAGRGMMPAFGEKIRPEGIEALVRHIRTLSDARPASPSQPEVLP